MDVEEKKVSQQKEQKEQKEQKDKKNNAGSEIDLTKRVKYFLRYGLIGLIALAVICASGIWYYQHSHQSFTVYDAQVTSTMVAARTKAPGTITEMVVSDGEHVEAGDVIAHIQPNVTEENLEQLHQNVDMAQKNLEQLKKGTTVAMPSSAPAPSYTPAPSSGNSAAVAQARSRMQRMQELYSMGAVSAVERDQAIADYQAAVAADTPAPAPSAPVQSAPRVVNQPTDPKVLQAAELAVKQAQAALTNAQQDAQQTDIVAPVSGTVYATDVEEGTEVKAGDIVVNIGDADNVWVEAKLQPADKAKVRLGQFAKYTVDGKEYQGSVQEVKDPADEAATGTFSGSDGQDSESSGANGGGDEPSDTRITVKLSIPSGVTELRPGMSAVVKFALNH